MKDNGFKSNRHSIYNLKYHLVVMIKYRHKCINKEILPVFWSRSCYILITGGATIEIIEKYIRSQAGLKTKTVPIHLPLK